MYKANLEKPTFIKTILPAQKTRVETGLMQFGDDWTGVFLRGDSAFHFKMQLEAFIEDNNNKIAEKSVETLIKLLGASREK